MSKCVICGNEITNYGNNPWPVVEYGRCCDECNLKYVVPERIKLANKQKLVVNKNIKQKQK